MRVQKENKPDGAGRWMAGYLLFVLLMLLMTLISTEMVLANCRDEGCGCSGIWDSAWAGNAQEDCVGTDCWYNPENGTGCSGHVWYLYRKMEPADCVTDGRIRYLCTNCSAIYDRELPAPGHTFTGWEGKNDTAHERVCTVCRTIEEAEHTFTDWTVVDAGYRWRTCEECDYEDIWTDREPPICDVFTLQPSFWTSGSGTVQFTVTDEKSGLRTVKLTRTSLITGETKLEKETDLSGKTDAYSDTVVETEEGSFFYTLTVTDLAGNSQTYTKAQLNLDHTAPEIRITGCSDTWTNRAGTILVQAEDLFTETGITASGVRRVKVKSLDGTVVITGNTSATLSLRENQEGERSWTVMAEDAAGNQCTDTFTTRYDRTKPVIEGSGMELKLPDGSTAEYCGEDKIDQLIYDGICQNGSSGSGIRYATLYRVKDGTRYMTAGEQTVCRFEESSADNMFHLQYELMEKDADYYLIAVQDFAGNMTTKKLVSRKMLLQSVHTSIDRSSYQ